MTTPLGPRIAAALATALTNDRKGAVSRADAKKIVNAGVEDILASEAPASSYAGSHKYIAAARGLVGQDSRVVRELDRFAQKGEDAVAVRLGQQTGQVQLPLGVKEAFLDIMEYGEAAPSRDAIGISNVSGGSQSGYRFDYTIGDETRTAHAIPYAGHFVLSPIAIEKKTLDAATAKMRAHFDEHFAPFMTEWASENTPAVIAAARAAIRPERAYFPGEYSDPYSFVETYPLVLSFDNQTGSDHGFFVGIDPKKPNEAEAYDFN